MNNINKTMINIIAIISLIVLFITPAFAVDPVDPADPADGGAAAPVAPVLPNTFTDLSANWGDVLFSLGNFIQYIAAISGFVLVILALYQMRLGHAGAQSNQQQGVKVGIAYLFIGGFLLGIGGIIMVVTNTVSQVDGGTTQSFNAMMNTNIVAPINLYQALTTNILVPFLNIINIAGPIIGIAVICIGIHRLRYHSNPQIMAMHRRSPMATGFYFVVGAIFIYPYYAIQALSSSMFSTPEIIDQYCGGNGTGEFLSYFHTLNQENMISYSNGQFQCTAVDIASTQDNLIQLTYAVLFVVGFISFLRGLFMLTRVGEHMGGGQASISQILAHIIAGIVAINANVFVEIMSNTYQVIIGFNP